jgi:hypothetical protein
MPRHSLALTVCVTGAAAALASFAAAVAGLKPGAATARGRSASSFRLAFGIFDPRVGAWRGAALTIESPGGNRSCEADRSR